MRIPAYTAHKKEMRSVEALGTEPQQLSKEQELNWLALISIGGLGTRGTLQLLEAFGTPEAIFRATRSELQAAGLSAGLAQSIASGCAFEAASDQANLALETGTTLVPITDLRYPSRLKQIYDPPPVLFARGRVELLETLMFAVVGTRRPTHYGTAVASKLSHDLAEAGFTIASGMARGIDTAAHRSVLDAGCDTVAVFGCGVDQLYPAENRKLAERLMTSGLVISEFPMGTAAYPQNFPVRNRIISGMSAGVLVVEGGEYSGSSITAKLAIEQGRDVYAVPGNITSKMSWGPNLLIRQGAKLVQEAKDVTGELEPQDRFLLAEQLRKNMIQKGKEKTETSGPFQSSLGFGEMEPVARAVLGALKADSPVGLDELIETLQASSSEIIAMLLELELAGLIRQVPGKRFLRVWTG